MNHQKSPLDRRMQKTEEVTMDFDQGFRLPSCPVGLGQEINQIFAAFRQFVTALVRIDEGVHA
jgi:hypothetical protein